jgi:hypothetical protein
MAAVGSVSDGSSGSYGYQVDSEEIAGKTEQ